LGWDGVKFGFLLFGIVWIAIAGFLHDVTGLWSSAIAPGVLGTAFLSISGLVFFLQARRARLKKYLLSYGMRIQTDFQSVQTGFIAVNRRTPFRIMTQWLDPATSSVRVFQSEDIWFDPTRYITQKHITVLIDKENTNRYYVDLSFLPYRG